MIAVIIILLVLFALAMIWLSINIKMEEPGLTVWVKIMFFKVQVYPRPKKAGAKPKKKKQTEKPAETQEKQDKPKVKRDYKGLARLALKAAGRIRRKLGINRLVFRYTAGGADPADTALQYGRVSAAVYGIMPEICRIFNVKHQDVSVNVDFDIPKPKVELDLSMGLYLWQLIYIGAATLIDFSKLQGNN